MDKRSFLLPWACCWWQKPHTYTSTTQSRTPFAAGSLLLWIAPWLCIQSCCHQQKRKIVFTGRGEINDLHQERNEGSRSARIHREGYSALRVKMKISLTFLIPKPESAQMQINLNHITARNQLEFQTLWARAGQNHMNQTFMAGTNENAVKYQTFHRCHY